MAINERRSATQQIAVVVERGLAASVVDTPKVTT
jgi:hypothetical protein